MTTNLEKPHWRKNIVLFLFSQTLSLFGSSLVQYAIMWYITLETKSGIMMTLSIICGFVPTFFLSPFGGVWADRYNRKWLIMLSDSLIALSTLIMAIVFLMGYKAFWLLFLMSVIRAFGAAVQTPAVNAFIPQIVPEEKLTRVNGTNASIQAVIMILSPMASGALLTIAPIEAIFFIDVITAAIAVGVMLVFLKVKPHAKALSNEKVDYLIDLKAGFSYVRNHEYVMSFFVICAIFFVLISPAAFLTPLQVARTFGSDVWRLTAIEIAFSIGMIAGGIVMATWGGFKNRVHTMILSTLIMGVCTLILGLLANFWIYLVVMAVFGITMPLFNTPSTVLLQEKVEEAYLGRVFGVMSMISSAMMPMGMLVFGPLADVIAIEWLLIVTGIAILGLAGYMMRHTALLKAGV